MNRMTDPCSDLLIHAHTDAMGSEAYHLKLSQRCAEAVKDWLVRKVGLDPAWFKTRGFGKNRLVVPTFTGRVT